MKTGVAVLVVIASALFSVNTHAARDFQMSCRGPLSFATGTGGRTTVIYIKKNGRKAGPNGRWLSPGTCAWHDRPISRSEPTRIFWPEVGTKRRGRKIVAAYYIPTHNAIINCAGNPKCVITFRIHNVRNKHYRSNNPAHVFVKFPF